MIKLHQTVLATFILLWSCTTVEKKQNESVDSQQTANSETKKEVQTQTEVVSSTQEVKESLSISEMDAPDGYYHVTVIDEKSENLKDTIVPLTFFDHSLYTFGDFVGTQFSASPSNAEDQFSLSLDDLTITFVQSAFDSTQHEIEFHDNGYVDRINDTTAWGIDGDLPVYELTSLTLKNGDETYILDEAYTKDLFNPNLTEVSTSAYKNLKGEILVQMANSDGAGGYYAIFIFAPDLQLKHRFVDLGF